MGYFIKRLAGQPVTVGASDTVVLGTSGLSAQGGRSLRLNLKVSGVTVGSGISVKLQHLIVDTFVDLASANSSVSIIANGVATLNMDAARTADQVDMPIAKQIRVVVTTAAGAAIQFDEVELLQASS